MMSIFLGIFILSSFMSSVIVLGAVMRSAQLSAHESTEKPLAPDYPYRRGPNEVGLRTKVIYTLRSLSQNNRVNF